MLLKLFLPISFYLLRFLKSLLNVLRGSGAGTLGVPLEGTRRVRELLGVA